MSKIIIRQPRAEELHDALKLIINTANDLRLKSGRKPWEMNIPEVPPLHYHLYQTDYDGYWAAFAEHKMVGFGAALLRGKQWYLAYLFVDPKYQSKGLGRAILERCMEYGRGKADSFALATFPYNETALALYSSFGMMPTTPVFEMHKKNKRLETIESTKLSVEEDNSNKAIIRINKLEKAIRGYSHLIDWRFFADSPGYKIMQFYSGAKWGGYSLIARSSLIAPFGAVIPQYIPQIMTESVATCIKLNSDICRLWVPGPNSLAYSQAIKLGFKIQEMQVILSTRPYGDFSRYCPGNLAMF